MHNKKFGIGFFIGIFVTYPHNFRIIIIMFDLNTYREQTMPRQCPYCYEDMSEADIIGETRYDVVKIGHNIGGTATVFECPCCFEKSFVHKESLKWRIP